MKMHKDKTNPKGKVDKKGEHIFGKWEAVKSVVIDLAESKKLKPNLF